LTGVFLARHGRTAFNATRRFQGHLPVPLDEVGREEAHALAEIAATRTWAAFVCSPLERARETAAIVAARIGMRPIEDARFAETDCGSWTGLTFDEVQAADPTAFAAFMAADPDFGFPDGESFAQQAERVAEGVEALSLGPTPALVVCHRGVMRLALAARSGDSADRTLDIANGTLLELT
jgi:broad specificity phosphatase PhoE